MIAPVVVGTGGFIVMMIGLAIVSKETPLAVVGGVLTVGGFYSMAVAALSPFF